MAVFHFEIKSDRRKCGKQTSALQHVKYINREGPYQDADERELIKMPAENIITGPELHEHAPGRELLLYSSPFGVIKQDDSGIRVSRNASTQTVAIALEVAKRLYGNALELRGQERFQQQAVTASMEYVRISNTLCCRSGWSQLEHIVCCCLVCYSYTRCRSNCTNQDVHSPVF